MRRFLRVLLVVTLLALVAGAVALGSLLADRERLTKLIADTLRDALALDLVLTAPVEATLWPRPGVRLDGVTLRPAGAAPDAPPVATARALQVTVPWATLLGGEPAVDSLVIEAPQVDGDALDAWRVAFRGADDGPPAALRWPTIASPVIVTDGRWSGAGAALEAIDVEIAALAAGRPLAVRIALTRAGVRHALTLVGTPRNAPAGVALDAIDATLRTTARDQTSELAAKARAEYSAPTRWVFAAELVGVLPDAGWPIDAQVALGRVGARTSVAVDGSIDGRRVDGDITVAGFDPGAPPVALLDALARGAEGTVALDRVEAGGVVLEGVRIEARPEPADGG